MYKRDNQLFVFWPFLVRFRINLGLNNLEFVNKSISAVNTLIVYLCLWSKNTLLHLIAGTYARAFDCRNVRSCIWLRERMLLCLIAGTYALVFDCGNFFILLIHCNKILEVSAASKKILAIRIFVEELFSGKHGRIGNTVT